MKNSFEITELLEKKILEYISKGKNLINQDKINNGFEMFNKALHFCNKIIEKNKADFSLYYKKAYILTELGNLYDAIKCYNECLKLKPDYYEAYCQKGELLITLCNHKEALNTYSKAIEIDNNRSDAYMGKALVYMDLQDYSMAFPLVKKAYRLDPCDEWCKCYYMLTKNMLNKSNSSNTNLVIPFEP
ncbi:tetratricopeptide repeat protein [Clostridium aestuarii]|uniref:Tetratricopeptide repeat protein n=1 Tax=Clostridium aestuarii TaxID=338193 RepID=A0ABT4CX25_9CLOT|nr:tetratricopeptide repeat protein [Clostridium aestuarii]MCY6483540.1 tetratricopeptide repeat protein [Clostridium aestuarii]